jgi:hypothetical protein
MLSKTVIQSGLTFCFFVLATICLIEDRCRVAGINLPSRSSSASNPEIRCNSFVAEGGRAPLCVSCCSRLANLDRIATGSIGFGQPA